MALTSKGQGIAKIRWYHGEVSSLTGRLFRFYLKGETVEDLKRKYAKFILEGCLKLTKEKPLYIAIRPEIEAFGNLLIEEAKKIGVTDIFVENRDTKRARELLLTKSVEECVKDKAFDRTMMNAYAKKDAAFALCSSFLPHSMDGVDLQKLGEVNKKVSESISLYRDLQSRLAWCIFGVANERWAKELFKEEEDALSKLWDLIFQICEIKEGKDPIAIWTEKLEKKKRQAGILNQMEIESLHYENSLGTDITVFLPEGYLFESAGEGEYIVNLPSEEVFTSPDYRKTEGIVYSSKPLLFNNVFIDQFWIQFEKGRAVRWHAKTGEEMLTSILEMDEGAHYLGECALVDDASKISQSKVLFQDTLFDENAACHFAVGRGFEECIQEGRKMSKIERKQKGINDSCTHVDFMIGTSDLKITAKTKNGSEVVIMENGNLKIE